MSDEPGGWDADRYDDQCAFVYEYGEHVTDLLDLASGDRVLDLGCGTGQLVRRLAEAGANVTGVDSSRDMIDAARERHGGSGRVQFVHGDARDLPALFGDAKPFDAVFSNAALHWIPADDHDAVLGGVATLLTSGGQFVAELGGRGNVARIVDGVRAELDARGYDPESPWYFPSVGEYAPRLEAHELEVRRAHLFDRPTELDGGADGLREWLAVFGDGLFASVPDGEVSSVVDAVDDRLRDDRFHDGVWIADYRRLRFRAVKVA
jgi:SAM-dependent methyltransferase